MATSLPPRPDDPSTLGTTRIRPLLGRRVRANLSTAELVEDAIRAGEGLIAAEGPLVVRTGKHTGRSPEDKFIVDEPTSRDKIWWGPVNRPISEAHYDRLRARLVAYCADKDLYAQDCLIGADPVHQRRLRVYTETAWASVFARNLFRRTTATDRIGFEPNFTIICVPSFQADPATEGTRTGTAILLHLAADGDHHRRHRVRGRDQEERLHGHELPHARRGRAPDAQLGQRRAGDRQRRVLRPVGHRQDHPVRRPGAEPHRRRRAWLGRRQGLFNFEGGCYAKTIRLSPMYEPDIFQTTRRFGTVLENVDLDPETRELDLDSERYHREHAGRLPAPLHRQRRSDRHDRPAADGRPPHRRRVRGPAAHLAG